MSTATSSSRTINRERGPARGGISKRRSGPVRTDRDGDVSMGGPPNGPKGRGDLIRGRQGKPVPTGPRRGVSGSGMGVSRPTRAARDPIGAANAIGGYVEIRVTGWKESKGNDKDCIIFLERKSGLKFRKPRTLEDKILIQVPLSKVLELLEWDNVQFASANLKIEPVTELPPSIQSVAKAEPSEGAALASNILQEVLRTRYDADAKLLNLSSLIDDPILQSQGFFVSPSTHTKLFPALMKVADMQFTTPAEKRDKVLSISLESNALADLNMVTALSQTFPDLQNLSLGHNNFKDWKSLEGWRWKFRKLQQLVLTGNPVASIPGYREEARRRYPSLIMLDMDTYPTPPVTAGGKRETRQDTRQPAAPMVPLPLQVKANNVEAGETQSLTANFLMTFFPSFDADRKGLIAQFYDAQSIFSYSVNTSAPRKPGHEGASFPWDNYIPKSRNLKRLNHTTGANRLFIGTEPIQRAWNSFPKTQHDSADPSKWCFDAKNVLLDDMGLVGIMICVHGEFTEVETVRKASGPTMRSFDRTFIIAPTSVGGVRVVSDMMVVRAWGGSQAWALENPNQQPPGEVQQQQQQQQQAVQPTMPVQTVAPIAAPQISPQPEGVPSLELQQQMCLEVMRRTNLTEKYAILCLEQTGWNFDNAMAAFQTVQAQGGLPPDAFVS